MDYLIPDGLYKIRNVEFNEQVAELIIPGTTLPIYSKIVGAHDSRTTTKLWSIVNCGSGGNQITISSAARPDIFANARLLPQGASLVGSRDRDGTIWTVVKVDGGYYLQSPDANFVWQLPAPVDNVPIILVRHTAEDNTKWTFELFDDF